MSVRDRLLALMANIARPQLDGTGRFIGSPRPLMELIGTSNGYLYHQLRAVGLVQMGRGRKAVWIIPEPIMNRYRRDRAS